MTSCWREANRLAASTDVTAPDMESDPDHPILPQAWKWQITDFHWRSSENGASRTLDITFWRDGATRRLRFLSPHDLKIEAGIYHTHGLAILDISSRGLEDKVKVINFEGHDGSPEFLAKDVFDLDDPANEVRRIETD